MEASEDELDVMEELAHVLDQVFQNKPFNCVFGVVVQRVGELGIHYSMSKDDFLKMSNEGISLAYDDAMDDVRSGMSRVSLRIGPDKKNDS